MGAIIIAVFALGIFGSTSYMAATCYGGVCPKMVDNSPASEYVSPVNLDTPIPPTPQPTN